MRLRSSHIPNLTRMASTTPKDKLIFAPGGLAPSQYHKGTLQRSSLSPSPLTQFATWFTAATSSSVHQPETVCLSTASSSGQPSSRFVYLKELDARGFVIYSNWETSRKAEDVRGNAYAALAFWWREVERQVRVEGAVERLSREESSVYYKTRGRGSKIGAWASEQSAVLKLEGSIGTEERATEGGEAEEDDGRAVLERRVRDVEKRFEGVKDEDIPCPEFWGGIRVVPQMVEFWQGRDSRLHDRFRYTRCEEGEEGNVEGWRIERLSP
ncbi:hypothetical protein MMC30_007008 [Trapelia coarctata]|nr:hypothetical protein [Trapelia coarctata]